MVAIGNVLEGRYKILRLIGEGGMGVVYEAERVGLGKLVAVKVLHPRYAENPELLARFEREAQASCRIGHPNIIEVFDIGVSRQGAPYMVMELLSGMPLSDLLARRGQLSLERTIPILQQVLSALAAAHDSGIVHRDVKPDNVFLLSNAPQEDFVKVLDFGISKFTSGSLAGAALTQTGSVLGTPFYLAPEQARGDSNIDQRADIYAVGVMAFQMLSGRLPYEGSNLHQLLYAISSKPAEPLDGLVPELPPAMVKLIHSALAKERDARPPDARAFQFSLGMAAGEKIRITLPDIPERKTADHSRSGPTPLTTAAAGQIEATATPTQWTEQAGSSRRAGLYFTLLALVALGVAGVAIWALLFSESTTPPVPPATAPQPTPPQPTAPQPAATPTPPQPALPAVIAEPALVTITVSGLPPGARVHVDGKEHRERPLRVEQGTSPIVLVARAPGYKTKSKRITPDRDQAIKLKLHPRQPGDEPEPEPIPPPPTPPVATPEPEPEPLPAPVPPPPATPDPDESKLEKALKAAKEAAEKALGEPLPPEITDLIEPFIESQEKPDPPAPEEEPPPPQD